MKKTIITLAALAALIYAVSAGMQWLTPRVEADLTDRVNVALAEQGLLYANVTTQGRVIVLTGTAPSEESKNKAIAATARVFGVADVKDEMVVSSEENKAKASKTYALTIKKTDKNIEISGQVDSEQSKNVIERIAATHYGEGNVSSSLVVKEDAPSGWRSAVGTVLFNIVNLEAAEAKIAGREIMISGTALDEMYNTQLSENLGVALPKEYKLALAVEIMSPTDVETAEKDMKDIAPAAGEEGKAEAMLTSTLNRVKKAFETCDENAMNTVKTSSLYFGFDRAEVTKEGNATAKIVAEALETCASTTVEVAGYTDTTGSQLYNQWLSEQRAEAGTRALVRQGIKRTRLTPKGYGETSTPGNNATKEGRAQNRRVDFIPQS